MIACSWVRSSFKRMRMASASEADIEVIMPVGYKPDWMERTGRKLKME